MISKKMIELVENSSVIREMFEEGKRLAKIYGADKVYDFSLGNPSVKPPKEVKDTLIDIINNENDTFLHGYMNNSGFEDVRAAIATSINNNYNTSLAEKNIDDGRCSWWLKCNS